MPDSCNTIEIKGKMHNFCINSCWQCHKNPQDVLIEPRVCDTNYKAPLPPWDPPSPLPLSLTLSVQSALSLSLRYMNAARVQYGLHWDMWLSTKKTSLWFTLLLVRMFEKSGDLSSFLVLISCIYCWGVTLGYDLKRVNVRLPNASGSGIHPCRHNPVEFPVEETHKVPTEVCKSFKTQNSTVICLYLKSDL